MDKSKGTTKMNLSLKMSKKFILGERGLEAIEYAVLVGLVTAGVIAAIALLGLWVSGKFNEIWQVLSGSGQ